MRHWCALPQRPLRHAATHRRHVSPLPCARTIAAWSRSLTSPATPGTSIRSRCRRIERLFCKNERADHPLPAALAGADHAGAGRGDPGRQHPAALLDVRLHLRYRGPQCDSLRRDARTRARKWAGSSMARRSSCLRRPVMPRRGYRYGLARAHGPAAVGVPESGPTG